MDATEKKMFQNFRVIASNTPIVLQVLSCTLILLVGVNVVKNWSDNLILLPKSNTYQKINSNSKILSRYSSSVSIGSTATSAFPCDGTPLERRQLASLGNSITDEQWEQMGACVAKREKTLSAIFSLHVSKSGGKCFSSTLDSKVVPISQPKQATDTSKSFVLFFIIYIYVYCLHSHHS